ncbi:MAG: SprT family zinc-dependent metalloprotease [Inconstantimicrobium porci]|nr:SprT family zinc-dependent metalloprotease [Inconstantimicrobium porci]MDD6771164.1 SprT family zinc-dependent metalloprotease [Inconstantimicrobium porci]MDY5911102.1 SprT family zinc-dependent metalloprotease [Inconstantimicrobium porci]
MKVEYNKMKVEFELIRSRRKSISITMKYDGGIIVRCPLRMKNDDVIKFIQSKSEWIMIKQQEIKEMQKAKVERTLENGSSLMFLGKEYPLEIIINELYKKTNITKTEDKIIITVDIYDKEKIKEELKKWYKVQCINVVTERIALYQKYFRDSPKEIKVKEQKSRWASCTYDNRILFNWRCVMADINAVDYIVVHEMCHFEYKNHSKEFWNSVENIMPDYKIRKQWLKVNGIRMEF